MPFFIGSYSGRLVRLTETEMSRSCVLQKTDRSQVSEDRTLKKTDKPNRSVRSDRLPTPSCYHMLVS